MLELVSMCFSFLLIYFFFTFVIFGVFFIYENEWVFFISYYHFPDIRDFFFGGSVFLLECCKTL